jgi:predicted DNA-binding protein with PD1-like motif
MRHLAQPGPAPAERIESFSGNGQEISFLLEPGLSLNQALTRRLVTAGMQSAALIFAGGVLSPFVYVVPAQPRDRRHVAYFSEPRAPGRSVVEIATATFGWRDGEPFVHCHGAWTEPGGQRRGGHMMPHETFVHTAVEVRAWASMDIRIAAEADAETNFSLFRPLPRTGAGGGFIVARIRPNQDICLALEEICCRHGVGRAVVRGSLGSLIGACFTDGRVVQDHATEVLVRSGRVGTNADGELRAELDMLVVDMQGVVHEGRLIRGENPVCITFELMLEALA